MSEKKNIEEENKKLNEEKLANESTEENKQDCELETEEFDLDDIEIIESKVFA